MADIILLQPKVGDWDKVRSHPSVPLGLLSASRLAAKEFSTLLIDTRLNANWKEQLKEELNKRPLCVGITSMTGRQISYALEISKFVKKVSNTPVVWGGIHCSLLPESTIADENIDILVTGEGEVTFLELARALANKSELKNIAGIWYKNENKIFNNQPRQFISNLDSLPELPLSLISLNDYLPVFKGRRTLYIETSRGCPNQCGFCYNAAYNKNTWRAFSAERVIKELSFLARNFKINSFYIIDDNFFVDLKRAARIAQGIIDEKLDLFLEIQGISINSALKMDKKYLELLVKAGIKKVHFGVESASEKILKIINKKINIEDVIKINRFWNKYDITIQYNFMCGFPDEIITDIRKTISLIFRIMKENPNALISPLCPYTPYPGTALYEKSLSNNFIKKNNLQDWQTTDYGDNLWGSIKRKRLLSSLFFSSMFLDKHRSKDMVQSFILKTLIDLYRPIAKFRFKHLFFRFMPELKIKELLIK